MGWWAVAGCRSKIRHLFGTVQYAPELERARAERAALGQPPGTQLLPLTAEFDSTSTADAAR